MPKPITAGVVLLLTLCTLSPSHAADAVGLKVGAKAPAFELKDQNGKTTSLQTLLKRAFVAVVFHRSADW